MKALSEFQEEQEQDSKKEGLTIPSSFNKEKEDLDMVSSKKINELVAKNAKLINNKNLFESKTMTRYIQELADLSIKKEIERYNRLHEKPYSKKTRLKVKLAYNAKNKKVAYAATATATSGEDIITIFINIGHQMFSKITKREILLMILKGLLAHEISHIINTDYRELLAFRQKAKMGRLYPEVSEDKRPVDFILNLEKLKEYIAGPEKNRKNFVSIGANLHNCGEDGYIEDATISNNNGSMIEGLFELREFDFNEMPTIEEMEARISKPTTDPEYLHIFNAITQVYLCYAKYGEIKYESEESLSDSEIIRAFIPCIKDLDKALCSNITKNRMMYMNNTIVILWDYISDYLEYLDSLPEPEESDGEGDGEGSEGGEGSSKVSKHMKGHMTGGSDTNDDMKTSGMDKSEDETEDRLSKKRKKTKEKLGLDDESEEETSEESKSSKEDSEEETSEPEEEISSDESEDETEASESEDSTSEEDPSEDDEESESSSDEIQDVTSEEGGRINEDEMPDEVSEPDDEDFEYDDEFEGSGYDSAADDIERILKEIATEKAEIEMEESRCEELNQWGRSLNYGDAHKGLPVKVNRMSEVPDSLIEHYERVAPELIKISKQLQKRVSQKLKDRRKGGKETNLYIGRRLEARTLIRNNGQYFYNTKLPKNNPEICVGVLLDESGSMCCSDRATYARATGLILYDFCRGLNIPVSVYGHSADIYKHSSLDMYSYAEFNSIDNKDKYRIMDVSARCQNRDGAALAYMYQMMEKRPEEIKLLFVISDGQPAASGYYGSSACSDMQNIVNTYRRKSNIITIAAAIGSDKAAIENIYGSDSFLDISELDKMPLVMTNIIIKQLKL